LHQAFPRRVRISHRTRLLHGRSWCRSGREEAPGQCRLTAQQANGRRRMSDDLVTIEIDGKPLKAKKGAMVIQVADDAGIYIPRFCYHEKLSVAANCRMCLVDVEKAPEALRACAPPVAAAMNVITESPKAASAQRAVMAVLRINRPLDCPVCDHGGACELQELARGYGSGGSRSTERKRIIKDENT